ncbi:hypothetical protein JTE90_020336 [Oedothorax gibbosus]|uniref:Uncharacterized protein n=1 Tax=Oedothorax gibbosus TaxID=931172 RepID=A0AAV6VP73_9ARAC|nr:hypothetical protein JTE90_020336 [Oedothorax gibbosus]
MKFATEVGLLSQPDDSPKPPCPQCGADCKVTRDKNKKLGFFYTCTEMCTGTHRSRLKDVCVEENKSAMLPPTPTWRISADNPQTLRLRTAPENHQILMGLANYTRQSTNLDGASFTRIHQAIHQILLQLRIFIRSYR